MLGKLFILLAYKRGEGGREEVKADTKPGAIDTAGDGIYQIRDGGRSPFCQLTHPTLTDKSRPRQHTPLQAALDQAREGTLGANPLLTMACLKTAFTEAGEEHLKPVRRRGVADPVKKDTGKAKAGERRADLPPLSLPIKCVFRAAEEEVLITLCKAIPEPQRSIPFLQCW